MFLIIGILVVFAMVFGGFMLSGGKLGAILKAAPFEFMMIGGAALGATIIGNSGSTLKGLGGGIGKIASGPKWKKQDYQDLLTLLYTLTRLIRQKGLMAIEAHIEDPHASEIFKAYPKIMKDHFAIDFIADTLRMTSMNLEDPHQVENAMEKQLEKHHHEALAPQHALQALADGLPALGIVAAVLGIIKTMSSISEPPEVLGGMIGGALVGTFMGVFLAYGFVGPMAQRLASVVEEEAQFYRIIRDVLVAHLHGNAAQVSVEIGRGGVPTTLQPSFKALDEQLSGITLPAT